MHLSAEALTTGIRELPPPPSDEGAVILVVARQEPGERLTPGRAQLTPERGLEGDRWGRKSHPSTDSQVTVMRADVARLIANGQPLSLFGDNLLVELDLSTENLPPGTRVQLGTALCEVTPKPHTGCGKFAARFGQDAREVTNSEPFRNLHLRGIHFRVLEPGEVSPGDTVRVLSRPASAT